VSRALGIDEATLAELPRYARSDRFTPLEKAALDLAVEMTATPAAVSGGVRRRLLAELTEGQYVELAATIAWENHRARLNRALGARAMGFTRGGFCLLPEPETDPEGVRAADAAYRAGAGPGPGR
jgi:alkylhydroperoxidase family enzyme